MILDKNAEKLSEAATLIKVGIDIINSLIKEEKSLIGSYPKDVKDLDSIKTAGEQLFEVGQIIVSGKEFLDSLDEFIVDNF